MEREALRKMGLSDEQIEAVIAAHKSVIDESFIPKHRLDEVITERDAARQQVKEQEASLKELKKFEGTSEELKQKVTELEEKAKEDAKAADARLAKERKLFALKSALLSDEQRPHDVELVAGMFDLDKLELGEDGTISSGYKEFRETLGKDKGFLFSEVKAEEEPTGFQFLSHEPVDGDRKPQPKDRAADFGSSLARERLRRNGIDVDKDTKK